MMLTPLELDIMKAVWRRPPITVRAVQAAIRPGRMLAYTTVMTIMDRLYHKRFLTRTLVSRTHHYEPAIDYTEVRDEAVETLIKSFFGSREKLIEFLEGEGESTDFVPRVTPQPVRASLDETLL
jgi:predicted transcriptional regulator